MTTRPHAGLRLSTSKPEKTDIAQINNANLFRFVESYRCDIRLLVSKSERSYIFQRMVRVLLYMMYHSTIRLYRTWLIPMWLCTTDLLARADHAFEGKLCSAVNIIPVCTSYFEIDFFISASPCQVPRPTANKVNVH